MLEHFGDLLRTQVLKKEKELIDKQLADMEEQGGKFISWFLAEHLIHVQNNNLIFAKDQV